MTNELLGAHPDLIRRGIFRGVDLNVLRNRFWRLETVTVIVGAEEERMPSNDEDY